MDFKEKAFELLSNDISQSLRLEIVDAIEKALQETWNEAKEQDAKLLDSWHIKKGGFTALAYEIRELKEK